MDFARHTIEYQMLFAGKICDQSGCPEIHNYKFRDKASFIIKISRHALCIRRTFDEFSKLFAAFNMKDFVFLVILFQEFYEKLSLGSLAATGTTDEDECVLCHEK